MTLADKHRLKIRYSPYNFFSSTEQQIKRCLESRSIIITDQGKQFAVLSGNQELSQLLSNSQSSA
jgi:hypothetical protein